MMSPRDDNQRQTIDWAGVADTLDEADVNLSRRKPIRQRPDAIQRIILSLQASLIEELEACFYATSGMTPGARRPKEFSLFVSDLLAIALEQVDAGRIAFEQKPIIAGYRPIPSAKGK